MAKASTYAGTLGAAGAVFFLRYAAPDLDADERRGVRRILIAALAVAAVATGLRFGLAAAWMSGDGAGFFDGDLWRLVWESGEDRATLLRGAALLLMLPAALSDRRPAALALAAAAAAATSFALLGHVHRLARAVPTALLAVHLLTVAFWLGALWPLWLVARRAAPEHVGAVAGRFGALALGLVGLLIAAGILVLAALLGAPAQLWTSSYGRLITLKVALVAGMLLCAAINKLRFTPRLRSGEAAALPGLRRSIIMELSLAAGILLATASLTTLTGPPSAE